MNKKMEICWHCADWHKIKGSCNGDCITRNIITNFRDSCSKFNKQEIVAHSEGPSLLE